MIFFRPMAFVRFVFPIAKRQRLARSYATKNTSDARLLNGLETHFIVLSSMSFRNERQSAQLLEVSPPCP